MTRQNAESSAGRALVGGFSFALLAGLALLSLLIVVMGARVYRGIDEAAAQNYQSRTVLSYIAGKVRAADAVDSVAVADAGGSPALVLSETVGDTRYNTYIYYLDGAVNECFTRADAPLDTRLGDRLVEVDGFWVSRDGRLLTVSVTDGAGCERTLSLYLQSGEKEDAA